ncbi:hypothetical protein FSPOR_3364 [Fusarium sporotrichioides]|jgi:hypothetical protein|uniref:Uncharacterized protein n=1 Tax=Fusarium sporotrichioides TaxID=5514 RepID=A0A395SG66_FUSSP|nr:hypothetical protein FSPOR_3364 [Fusarium sporotrichioides]
MAAKTPLSHAAYQPVPREEDPSADLLEPSERGDRDDGKSALLRVKFSFILLLRFLVAPIAIADIVFMCNPYYSPASAGIFATGGILLALWHGFRALRSCFPRGSHDNFNLKIGSLFCMCGTTSNSPTRSSKVWAYLVSLVDFSFGLFFIGPSVTACNYGNFNNSSAVAGLSITLVVMQSVIAFLNLFGLFRKMTIAVYKDDDEQNRLYSIPELFRDEASEPRDSMSSEV